MMALGLGLTWAAVVALVLGERRIPARHPDPTGPTFATDRVLSIAGDRTGVGRATPSLVTAIGAWLRRRAGRPPDSAADRRVGGALLLSAALAPWAPPLAIVPVAWSVLAPTLVARRTRRAHEAAVTDQLPDVVDLLHLTTAAGLPIATALCAIRRRPGGPVVPPSNGRPPTSSGEEPPPRRSDWWSTTRVRRSGRSSTPSRPTTATARHSRPHSSASQSKAGSAAGARRRRPRAGCPSRCSSRWSSRPCRPLPCSRSFRSWRDPSAL